MKHVILSILLLCGAAYAHACTVCGCSASNQYLGILPQFNKHFIGLQYQYREFESHHLGHGAAEPMSTSREYYNTVQLWGRVNLGRRLQLFAFLPYVSNRMREGQLNTTTSGIGDATLLVNYRLLVTPGADPNWTQHLQAGGGVKMPTGSYDEVSIQRANGLPNMQPGTKSWDFLVNANYSLKYRNTGINLDASYTFTTPNPMHYKYGNRLSVGMLGFYQLQKEKLSLIPHAGLRLDVAGADYDNYLFRWKNDMSGGNQLYASVGVQANYSRLGFQLAAHLPIAQHFASGLVHSKFKAEAGCYFLF